MLLAAVFAGGAGMVIFLYPLLKEKICNIGNMTGIILSACLIFCGLYPERICRFAGRMWVSGPVQRIVLLTVGALFSAIVVTTLVLTVLMAAAACRKPGDAAFAVVLGCQVKGDRPSRTLTRRMDRAVAWLKEHPDVLCIVSGGKGENEQISEAECMVRYMTEHGIGRSRIRLEDRSASTRENLLFSREIIRKEIHDRTGTPAEAGRAPGGESGAGRVVIVTSEFHMCRALGIAESLGMECGALASGTPWWLFPTFYVRELYGLLHHILLALI